MATPTEMTTFLAEVERRAFKQALYATHDEDAALDIVQDAMLKLADRYAHAPAAELPLLFQRILQNTIRDHYRRSQVRNRWISLFSLLRPQQGTQADGAAGEADFDPDELLSGDADGHPITPEDWLARKQLAEQLDAALENLPLRQRQAFLLRYWEGMDVADTAAAMGCSQGSVKTHCSRATHALAAWLSRCGVTL